MIMTRIILVRHGETEWNKKRRRQGQSNVPLNKNGILQIRKVAERLKDEKIDVIYSSPLSRAHRTAVEIAKEHGLGIIKDDSLKEISYGVLEGIDIDELKKSDLWVERSKDKYNFKPVDGESYKEVSERAVNFIEKIVDKHRGKTILIASHSAFIKSLLIKLLDMDKVSMPHMILHNTSITEIEFENDVAVLKVLNDSDHVGIPAYRKI